MAARGGNQFDPDAGFERWEDIKEAVVEGREQMP